MKKFLITLVTALICTTTFAQHKDFSTMSFDEIGKFMEGVWEYVSPDGKTVFTIEYLTTQSHKNEPMEAHDIIGCYRLIKDGKVIEDNLYKLDKYRGLKVLGENDYDYSSNITIYKKDITKSPILDIFELYDRTTGLCAACAFFEIKFSYIKLISSKKGQEAIFMHLEEGEGEYEELPNNPDRIFSMPTDMTLKKKH